MSGIEPISPLVFQGRNISGGPKVLGVPLDFWGGHNSGRQEVSGVPPIAPLDFGGAKFWGTTGVRCFPDCPLEFEGM